MPKFQALPGTEPRKDGFYEQRLTTTILPDTEHEMITTPTRYQPAAPALILTNLLDI